jgi:hypothetical protein
MTRQAAPRTTWPSSSRIHILNESREDCMQISELKARENLIKSGLEGDGLQAVRKLSKIIADLQAAKKLVLRALCNRARLQSCR